MCPLPKKCKYNPELLIRRGGELQGKPEGLVPVSLISQVACHWQAPLSHWASLLKLQPGFTALWSTAVAERLDIEILYNPRFRLYGPVPYSVYVSMPLFPCFLICILNWFNELWFEHVNLVCDFWDRVPLRDLKAPVTSRSFLTWVTSRSFLTLCHSHDRENAWYQNIPHMLSGPEMGSGEV